MAVNWTERQLKAMEPTDKLTVLSAAAGSGKTTVLVERALRLLLDEDNPVNAEKLLIVTFSNASAAEFRNRIEKGINKKIRENPENIYMKMQKTALRKADISTRHSFCIKLVRENFQSLDISPDFTICDDAQSDDLHNRAIDKAMEYGYSLPDFKQLVSFYGKSSNDKHIREFLRNMFYFFSALPHPDENARKMAENYGTSAMKDTPAYKQLKKSLINYGDYLMYLADRMDEIYRISDFEGYEDGIIKIKNQSGSIYGYVINEDYEKLQSILSQKAISLGRAKPRCAESEAINKRVYEEYKKVVKEMAEITSFFDEEIFRQQTDATVKYVKVLFAVYLEYCNVLLQMKKAEKAFEFSDFEHFALELLQNKDGSPTALAEELRLYYEYIMEDEFQDTSYVQDAIFTMIAKERQKNLYVVGDVKQSIYGFRKASPRIFLDKRQIGTDDPDRGNTIYLPHNFRSSYNVISGVNHIFSQLMSRNCGGVEYDENEALKTLKSEDNTTGIQLNIYTDNEAANTAATISRMIKEGYRINDGGNMRRVKSGDFCILMRNKKHFKEYKNRLEAAGYEAFVSDDEIILQQPEVQNIVNLLKVVANPLQEVYLTAAMFGDLFDFSLDEILKIRLTDKKANLYKALALSDNPKAAYFLEVLKELTFLAGVYSPDKLIDHLCRITGYYGRLAFSDDGIQKRENLRWFMNFAKNWAKTHPSDLPAFLRWVDVYIQSGAKNDFGGEKSDNAVAIMTMHTSKGLEFPVVFVTGLATKFNTLDTTKRLLLDVELGVGMYANTKFGYNNSTLNIQAIKNKTRLALADEEMRLLYVAFTRSKNLLILSAAYNNIFTANTLGGIAALTGAKPHPVWLQRASSPVQWVLAALAGHCGISDLFSYGKQDKLMPRHIEINLDAATQETVQTNTEYNSIEIPADIGKITANLNYVYPHIARTALPIKMSVSELVKNSEITLAKPDFIRGGKATAGEKGSAMHRFSQHRNIELARKDLDSEILRLENHKLVSSALLNKKALKNFINSPVADRILTSEKVYREKDFVVTYNACKALNDSKYSDDEIMVQGVMDCVLENGDEITVIDYKTDNVADMATLFKRYESQLEYYRYAAKQIFKKENVKCLLYSFRLNEYIEF